MITISFLFLFKYAECSFNVLMTSLTTTSGRYFFVIQLIILRPRTRRNNTSFGFDILCPQHLKGAIFGRKLYVSVLLASRVHCTVPSSNLNAKFTNSIKMFTYSFFFKREQNEFVNFNYRELSVFPSRLGRPRWDRPRRIFSCVKLTVSPPFVGLDYIVSRCLAYVVEVGLGRIGIAREGAGRNDGDQKSGKTKTLKNQ